jgi:hypothetical protein
MSDAYLRQRIENWASDFCGGDGIRAFPPPVPDYAPEVLVAFLTGAADGAGGLDDVGEPHVRKGLVEGAARVEMPGSVRAKVPELCAAFLEELEREGRLGDGRRLATFVRAAKPAFDAAGGPGGGGVPFTRKTSKLSPNDPCPCGSGRKFKKCCSGMLG